MKWFERSEKNATTHEVDPAYMTRWIIHVKARVPPEKLLVWSVKEGYAPLCKFLNVPMIKEPFPHVNETKRLVMILGAQTIACNFVAAAWLVTFCSIVYSLYNYSTAGTMTAWIRNLGGVCFFVAIMAQLRPVLVQKWLIPPSIMLYLFGVYILPIAAGSVALVMNRAKFGL